MKTSATKNENEIIILNILYIVVYFRQGGQTNKERIKYAQIIVSNGVEPSIRRN